MRHYKIMFDNTKITVYFNEHIRCFYDGTIERLQIKNGNTKIVTPKWKTIKNVGHKPYGYNKIGINDKMFLRHRIIAFCYYGNFDLDDTSVEIDHRDGNIINNCVENLKVGTKRQNNLNRREAKHYSWIKKSNRWIVTVSVNGEKYYGGLFKIGEEMARDSKITELINKYQKPIYNSLLKDATEKEINNKEYPIIIEQLKQKIKELENVILELKNRP
jgi:hypothetical protein